jgi:hypothetical protein
MLGHLGYTWSPLNYSSEVAKLIRWDSPESVAEFLFKVR